MRLAPILTVNSAARQYAHSCPPQPGRTHAQHFHYVSKASLRVEAYGNVDELNTANVTGKSGNRFSRAW